MAKLQIHLQGGPCKLSVPTIKLYYQPAEAEGQEKGNLRIQASCIAFKERREAGVVATHDEEEINLGGRRMREKAAKGVLFYRYLL